MKLTPLQGRAYQHNGGMKRVSRALWVMVTVGICLSGCTYTRFTNLTPSNLPRDPSGNYPVEMAWESNDRTIIDESVRAYVVVNNKFYPMNKVQIVEDRWEAMIPVPSGTTYVDYHYKVDFDYRSLPRPQSNSDLSIPYMLLISEDFQSLQIDDLSAEY